MSLGFFVRPRDIFGIELVTLAGDDLSSYLLMSQISAVSLGSARAGSRRGQVRSRRICERHCFMEFLSAATASWLRSRRSQPPLALAVPLSRYASRLAGWPQLFSLGTQPFTFMDKLKAAEMIQAAPPLAFAERIQGIGHRWRAERVYLALGCMYLGIVRPRLSTLVPSIRVCLRGLQGLLDL